MNLTDVESKIMHVLMDGNRHGKQELVDLVDVDMSIPTMQRHISNIRSKLSPGYEIICEIGRQLKVTYRYVRIIHIRGE